MTGVAENCRLCGAPAVDFGAIGPRRFQLCSGACGSVFVARESLPSAEEERQRYLQHHNEATPEYEAFLSRLAEPLAHLLPPQSRGLDFGCGPVPVLAQLLEKRGHTMASYDPQFFDDRSLLQTTYDFITCSETAEHFHEPGREFARLNGLLKTGGQLAVMTQMRTQWEGFFDWHYPRDPTHVMFYSPKTMRWVAGHFGWEPMFVPQSVVIFRKSASAEVM